MQETLLSRRDFLKVSAAAGGGLLVGFVLPGFATEDEAASANAAGFTPNAWIHISDDDIVTLQIASSEMGQGVMTGIAMLLAEELDADWSRVKTAFAPADPVYKNPLLGRQATGGSTAVRAFWTPLREAGAVARELLVKAAAQRWGVDAAACRAAQGTVTHTASKRNLRYGALAASAAALPVPEIAFLKEPDEFSLLGRSMARLDIPAKVDGSAVFGIDVRLPGLLTASVARCPVIGGRVSAFDAEEALSIPGVTAVRQISSGVAVIANDYWSAKRGRDALRIEWDPGGNAAMDSTGIFAAFEAALQDGVTERNDGNARKALDSAASTLQAVYTVPYQAHACMEPMNATADVRADGCDLYLATQNQSGSQETAMRITGLPRDKVRVHTTFLGGGFGRRAEQDFVAEAVECSRAVGKPVKVIWTREDDLMHDQYRPAGYNALRGGVDKDGRIVAWEHRIASPSILARVFPDRSKGRGSDPTSIEGAANLPYAIPDILVSYAMVNPGVPVGFWRSVGSSQNAWITECFFDELAALAGRDPLQARLELLGGHPRHAGVLKLAAARAGWRKPLPAGRARGIAVAEAFGSFVAEVAEVSIERGRVRVHRVTCAIDCGMTVNPDSIRAQMESGIVYGLSAALKGAITLKGGRVMQSNFDSYPLLRMDECPHIDVHIVNSSEAPGGVGEPGVPPAAPAVANAVFALTGKPVRSLPIQLGG